MRTDRGALGARRHWMTLVAIGLWAVAACGSTPPAPPSFAPVVDQIPADAPFALVVAKSDDESDVIDVLEAEEGPFRILRDHLTKLLGRDLADEDDRAALGLDLSGDLAIFGDGLRPTVLIRIEDEAALVQVLQEARERDPSRVEFAGGEAPWPVKVRIGGVSVALMVQGEYLKAVYSGARVGGASEADEPNAHGGEALVEGARRHSTSTSKKGTSRGRGLATSGDFVRSLNMLGSPGAGARWRAILFVQTGALDRALLARASPSAGGEACRDRSEALAAALPGIVMGWAESDASVKHRAIVRTSSELSAAISSVLPPLDGRFDRVAADALVAFGVRLDVGALVALDTIPEELARCESLAALEGAVGVVARGLGRTDAREALGGGVYVVVQGLDLSLPWVTERKIAILVEGRDVQRTIDGLALILRAFGAVDRGYDGATVRSFELLGGAIRLRLGGVAGYAALTLGKVDRAELDAALSEPGGSEPRRPSASLRLAPERLREALAPMSDQLAAGGMQETLLHALVRGLDGIDSAGWSVWIEDDGVRLEGGWKRAQ